MKLKLTFRYIGMVILSTVILLVLSFVVLTYLENSMNGSDHFQGNSFAYNFVDYIEVDADEDIVISDRGEERLLEQNAWVQMIDREGYVVESLNAPSWAANHYSPVEIVHLNIFADNNDNFTYYTRKINDDLNYLMALPAGSWHRMMIEFDDQMVMQFIQIMLVLALFTFLIMGYIFSIRIAQPVTEIIEGVEDLAEENYQVNYQEEGLYGRVFTSLNQLAKRLTQSDRERKKTIEQREKWVSNLSHDLKTPLSSIKGYSEILADTEYDVSSEEVKQYSTTIYEKSIYMENLIEELRLNERLIHNSITLQKKTSNLTAFIREIVIDILNHPDYKERTITFHAVEDEIPFSFDSDLFKRSFENLIYNAVIHNSEDTEIFVNLDLKNEHIKIEIKDDGQGMNDEELSQLFNRYYRGSNTKNHNGTGLGMSIAKEVIEAHDGEISAESAVNEGTRISITL